MTGRRERLDRVLVQRGLEQSRDRARQRIEDGHVRVGGLVVRKPASMVAPDAHVELVGEDPIPFVSRGGLKLQQALDDFHVDVQGWVAADIGASTGGFTDCLLQRGAARVYAIDVGYGQLAWPLRQDPRVAVLERTNIRSLPPDAVPEPVDGVVIDCSFIGLDRVLPPCVPLLRPGGRVIALVKPQFEVGRAHIASGGVVRDAKARQAAIDRLHALLQTLGFTGLQGVDCRTHGPAGNVEYLLTGVRAR
jgi:23S rRNA (cytidine1920-2'-O)/16S rRNA (cytidine1409-2'-O)-methyltransferase